MSDKYVEVDKMSDVISDDYRLLQVISRFGLTLGFGEKTVKEVCNEQHVDCPTFLAVVNFTKYGERVTAHWVEKVSVESLTNYLRNAHDYYLTFLLPNIRRKLLEAIDCSVRNEVAFLILKFYDEYVAEVRRHMEYENSDVFTYVDELIKGINIEPVPFNMDMFHQDPVEEKLTELKNIIIKYYGSNCNANLLNTVLYDIFICEEDLYMHYRMEEGLYVPSVRLLEEQRREGLEETDANEQTEADTTDVLSDREKDIVIGVVKGLTNKEIADKLFISVNTVTTHRRNIARKLDIHSPAGLTIYAMVNKLIEINDLKL